MRSPRGSNGVIAANPYHSGELHALDGSGWGTTKNYNTQPVTQHRIGWKKKSIGRNKNISLSRAKIHRPEQKKMKNLFI